MYLNKYNKFLLLYCAFVLLPLAKMAAASNSAGVINHNHALYSAVMSGNGQEAIKQIKNHNANINMKSSSGSGLLCVVINCFNGIANPTEMMQLLIDQGIDKAQHSDAFELATQRGAVQAAECLMKNGVKPTIGQMREAAKNGCVDLVTLFAQKVGINEKDEYGHRPLLYAIENRHHEVVEYLITKGAQIDGEIWRRLIGGNAIKSIEFLLDNHKTISNFDTVDEEGSTPLYLALLMQKYDIMERLVNAGASVDRVDAHDLNVLDYATLAKNDVEILLRSKGALTWREREAIKKREREALANEKKDTQKPGKELTHSTKYPTPSRLQFVGPAFCAGVAIGAAGVWYFYKYRNQPEKKNEQSVATAAA